MEIGKLYRIGARVLWLVEEAHKLYKELVFNQEMEGILVSDCLF